MSWCTRRRIYDIEVRQTRIEENPRGCEVADRRDTADGEASRLTDKGCIRAAQRLARHGGRFLRVDDIAACGDEKGNGARRLSTKDDRLGDLVDCATGLARGICCGSGLVRHFEYVRRQPCIGQRCHNAFQALAHLVTVAPVNWIGKLTN